MHIGRVKQNDFLTSTLCNRQLLAGSQNFAANNQRFVRQGRQQELGSQWALMLMWESDKTATVRMVAAVTLLSVLVGVLVGVLGHDASLGIAVSSGIAAVLSCLEMLVVWHYR